jgi:hypothetical protein
LKRIKIGIYFAALIWKHTAPSKEFCMNRKKSLWFLAGEAVLSAFLLLAVLAGCSDSGTDGPDPVPPDAFTTIPDNAVFSDAILYRTAFGKGKFVITGAGSTAWHSSDGITWTAASDPAGLKPRDPTVDNISGLNFVKDQFLATGGSGQNVARAFSSDGDVWTSTNLGTDNANSFNAKGVAYGNGKYLAGGSGGRIAYTDALNGTATWTVIPNTTTNFSTGFINAVAFGAGKFVAGGAGGLTVYSSDLAVWTENTDAKEVFNNAFINDIVYGGGKFVGVGEADGTIAWSTDGLSWTQAATIPEDTGVFRAVAYGGGYFVAVGGSPSVVYSDDGGLTWTASTTTITGNLYGVAYGNSKFVISGGAGQVAYAVVFE